MIFIMVELEAINTNNVEGKVVRNVSMPPPFRRPFPRSATLSVPAIVPLSRQGPEVPTLDCQAGLRYSYLPYSTW